MIPAPQVTFCHAGTELRRLNGAAFLSRTNSQDDVVYKQVVVGNEYLLPDKFSPKDIIIDIGANIGLFALACMGRGAKKIECYEPDPDNFELLEKNLKHRGALVFRNAVGRSDRKEDVRLMRPVNNHAAKSLTAMSIAFPLLGGERVESIGLNEILSKHKEVRLVKMDCEGSEYAAVMTASMAQLKKCRVICGELHVGFGKRFVPREWNSEAFCRRLEKAGFEVAVVPSSEAPQFNQNFWAFRKDQ